MAESIDVVVINNHKRESDSCDEDLIVKKSKTSVLDIETVEKSGRNNDSCEPQKTEHVDSNLQLKTCEEESITVVVGIEADAAEDKGSRLTMEDAWVIILPDANLDFSENLRCAHFAIYDGHRGRLAAEYAKKHLHANVLSAGLPRFRRTDESILQESAAGGWQDGSTAVCLWILGRTVFVANIGDAKAVVARSYPSDESKSHFDGEGPLKAIVLTREHKAIYPQERARILKAGGSVTNGRLQGRLEVSRAFGDRQFKKVGVCAIPDVHSFDLTKREHFIILGCDGLWGVFGPSDAVDFVQAQLKEGLSVTSISRRLVREAVRERGCKDNCTAIVTVFKHT
ncbi:hypothetical protein AQUCO_04100116v1 [Aquilegia coerulea]|uniref:PPM-type phosphatase domain-containing protein n=1 Tax=Aquilegia coerulea TaxID=218851 RepID=A0A2G5CQJ9_AQUCA|nr:hypothetical protein AQUCO_04100116v1 [Aquilegia coerulea]